ncbi:uncharacterized protein LOC34620396 [Cyclospora cayetanensis]|uniref:Uncharacterized protein LOC34620396 n=1 Tax=Cyclospora cayetanensis TaxID=88456 RepID=A0A6P6S0H7_9EIME|nr:uncharacterized protein LOC34620396 [Cyclospora cayetanensis]
MSVLLTATFSAPACACTNLTAAAGLLLWSYFSALAVRSAFSQVVPILNENDSICTEELRFGDNDTLAAHCAVALEADFLFILTDVDCLYTKNPKAHAGMPRNSRVYGRAKLNACIACAINAYNACIACSINAYNACIACAINAYNACVACAINAYNACIACTGGGGAWGTGGMYTKVVASKIATNLGVHVGIVNGAHPDRSAWRASGRSGVQGSLALNAQSSAPVSDLRVLPAQWCSSPPEPSAAALSTDLAADVAGAEHSPRRRLSSSLVVEAGVESESSCSSKKSVLEDDSPTAEADTNTGNLPVASPLNCTCTAEQLTGGVAPEIAPLPTPAATTTEATGNQLACAAVGFHKRWHSSILELHASVATAAAAAAMAVAGTIFISNAPTGPSQSVRLPSAASQEPLRRW